MPQKKEWSTLIQQEVKNNLFGLYKQDKKLLSIQKIIIYLDTIKNTISFNKHITKYVRFITFYSIFDNHIVIKDNMINIIIAIYPNSKKTLIDFCKKVDCFNVCFLFCF